LLDNEAVEVRLDIAREKTKRKLVAFLRRGFITASFSSVKVATETLSPKFVFMNSASLVFNSSGEGNGGF